MTSVSDKSIEAMADSLTGFDEIAIEKHMGIDPYKGAEDKPVMWLRALVFVDQRRVGLSDTEAKDHALSLPGGVVATYFTEDTEVNPDDPETELGKGD